MDELDVGGKKYISSKRASELTGYAKDYIGQLLRAGKVSGTRFGRAWYVEESEILRHAGKAPIPDVPPAMPSVPEMAQTPLLQKAEKPLLTHHMITPAEFPKTWSNIQYFEDTSDLFPAITPATAEVVSEINPVKESTSEVVVPVSITRTRASVEKRVASLVDGIRPRSPMLRVASPSAVKAAQVSAPQSMKAAAPARNPSSPVLQIKKTTEDKKPAQSLQKVIAVRWSPGSFATAFAAFIFVFGSFLSFFFIKNISLGNSEVLTASTFYGLTDFLDLLKEARILEGGLDAVRSFYHLLTDSFFVFLKSGSDFILNLF